MYGGYLLLRRSWGHPMTFLWCHIYVHRTLQFTKHLCVVYLNYDTSSEGTVPGLKESPQTISWDVIIIISY